MFLTFSGPPNHLFDDLQYSKASRYTALSCTDLGNARFRHKKIWDAQIYEVKTLTCMVYDKNTAD